jgi:hypothetical protein
VFSLPFPSNGLLFYLHISDFQPTCHNMFEIISRTRPSALKLIVSPCWVRGSMLHRNLSNSWTGQACKDASWISPPPPPICIFCRRPWVHLPNRIMCFSSWHKLLIHSKDTEDSGLWSWEWKSVQRNCNASAHGPELPTNYPRINWQVKNCVKCLRNGRHAVLLTLGKYCIRRQM